MVREMSDEIHSEQLLLMEETPPCFLCSAWPLAACLPNS